MIYQLKIKGLIIFLIIFGLILPSFSFLRSERIMPPETPEEIKELGEKAVETTKEEGPGISEKIWKEEILPVWQRMWSWTKNYWNDALWPWITELCSSFTQRFTGAIKGFWERRIKPPMEEEVEKKKEVVEERVEEGKKEIEEKLKNLWK